MMNATSTIFCRALAGTMLTVTTSAWASQPVAFEAANTTDAFGIVDGGVRRGVVVVNKFEAAITLDGTAMGLDGLRARASAFRTDGDSVTERIGDVQTATNLEAIDTARLFEAWIEQEVRIGSGKASLRAGLLNFNAEFDAIAPAGLFVNSSHGIGPDVSKSGRAGPSIFPVTGVGARAEWRPSERWAVRVAAFDGVPGDPAAPRAFAAAKLRGDDGALLAAEVNAMPAEGSRIGLGAWRYTRSIDPIDASSAPPRAATGVYAFATAAIDARWAGWIRAGIADGRVQSVAGYVGGGLVGTGVIAGRADDQIGIAVGHAVTSGPLRVAQNLPPSETAIEATYRYRVTRSFALQPGVQYIIAPAAQAGASDALALYLRVALSFPGS